MIKSAKEGVRKVPAVQIMNLTKKIGDKTIIKNLSFDVYHGEIFGFLGPNGAGKTTTIRMLFGLTRMNEGEIFIDGYSITKDFEKAVSHIGGIVENPDMYNYLTGYENLLHFQRMTDGVDKNRIDEVVKLVGLENRIRDKVRTYSLGMRQRLGLAQAILHSPAALVLDEPTNGLDPAGIKELRDYLKKIAQVENVAVIVSSHLLSEVELMCDRVGIIQLGSLVDIIDINACHAAGETAPKVFSVDPVSKAREVFQRLKHGRDLIVGDSEISIRLDRESIPGIVDNLVNEGVRVYGIGTQLKTLEERFLELTGGGHVE